jgi:capsular polysaccharide transport system permease protein
MRAAVAQMELQSLPPTPKKRSALQIQRAVLFALVVRELRARVQGHWIGLLRKHTLFTDVELPVYLVTGLLPFFMFRNLARRVPGSLGANRGLFAYRQVKPIDALVARAAVEVGLYGAVFVCALALLGWLGYGDWPDAPLELLAVMAVLITLGLGLGLIFAVLAHGRPRVNFVIGLIFFPIYLLSGVIFPVRTLPVGVRDWLLWNPVLHLIELARVYFIAHLDPLDGVSFAYPAACALVCLAFGMSLYRLYRHHFLAAG